MDAEDRGRPVLDAVIPLSYLYCYAMVLVSQSVRLGKRGKMGNPPAGASS